MISAVIITHNEERNIKQCIKSAAPIVDEVLVVDSYSDDRTAQIAEDLGARVLQREWQGFSNAKNWANQQALHQYVLSLDADEVLSQQLQESISNARDAGLVEVYEFNRLTNYCGKWIRHCGWYPDKKAKLFLKNIAKWEGDYVHEEITFQADVDRRFLKGDLLHYSYYTVDEHRDRVRKYATLGAQRIIEQQKDGLWWRAVFGSSFRFFRMYMIQLGFLDGRMGWHVCMNISKEVCLKYSLARKLKKQMVTS